VKTISKYLILLFCFTAFSTFSVAQNSLIVHNGEYKQIGKHIEYFVDSSNKLNIEDLENVSFNRFDKDIVNFGNIPHNVWMRFSVLSQAEKELFLEIKAPILFELKVYKQDSNKFELVYTGSCLEPFIKRPLTTENWLVNLKVNHEKPSFYYIKVQSLFSLQLPIAISGKNKYVTINQLHNLFWGIYIGIMAFAFLYNFFIFLSVRERIYLFYLIYILTSATFYLGVEGFGFAFMWPQFPKLNLYLPVIICLTNVVVILFSKGILQVTKKQKVSYYFGSTLLLIFILIAILNISGQFTLSIVLAQLISLVASFYYLVLGISSYMRSVPSARFFLLAWSMFLILAIIGICAQLNVISSNFFTIHGIFIGHMTEVLLLSFALADRINWLKTENENKQKEIIFQLEENDKLQLKVNLELEQKVTERTSELRAQKERSDELLLNILPEEVAEELKAKGHADAQMIEQVTVLFTDFKGFTEISEHLTPQGLVSVINECFSEFDNIMEKHGVEKIKTIGDSYMAAGGLPSPNKTHALDVVKACMEIQEFMRNYKVKMQNGEEIVFEARIGVHTGPVVAGIVGLKKFAYDIWGDTVNTASRMESSGEVGMVNISETTYEYVKDYFTCVHRGKISAKGKGQMDMYFVKGPK